MIHHDTHFTTSIETGYHRVVNGKGFEARSGRVRIPGRGTAPCWDIVTAHDQWGADRPAGMREWQLTFTLSGEGCFYSGSSIFHATKNVAVLYPPGCPQKYGIGRESPSWEHLWVVFNPQPKYLPFLSWPHTIPGVPAIELPKNQAARRLVDFLLLAHYHHRSGNKTGDLHALLALESFLLGCIDLHKPSVQPIDSRVTATLALIEREYASPLTIDYLAKKCGLSVSRIEHLVREQTGIPIRVHLENERIRRAKQLLEFTKQTISEIAFAAGYQSARHFCTRFKLAENLTPGAFRAACLVGHERKLRQRISAK